MVLPWFSAEKKEDEGVPLVGFLQRVVAATMRCFFGCFRSRDSHSRFNSTPREPRVSYNDNALSSLFLSDDDSHRNGREGLNSPSAELEVEELENEAKFLKACGTLADTPVEIKKASRKWMDTSAPNEEPKSSSFKSWILSSSREKQQPDGSPTHVRKCQEWAAGVGYLVGTPSSCMSDEQNTGGDSVKPMLSVDTQDVITSLDLSDKETHLSDSSVPLEVFATSVQGKHKSVRFECESVNSTCSLGSSDQCLKPSLPACKRSSLKASPNPTPLKLTDDMQTPGTVFPAYMDDIAGGKACRVRSQYEYSVLNPIDCPLQWKEFKDENSDPNTGLESLEPNHAVALTSTPSPNTLAKDLLRGKDRKDCEDSLSPWLKSHSTWGEQYNSTVGDHLCLGTPPRDRLIVEKEAVHWDRMGMPNTTKYKEDKQVSWHATPFEESLERALFEETSIQ